MGNLDFFEQEWVGQQPLEAVQSKISSCKRIEHGIIPAREFQTLQAAFDHVETKNRCRCLARVFPKGDVKGFVVDNFAS
jgi:hypothetical protein